MIPQISGISHWVMAAGSWVSKHSRDIEDKRTLGHSYLEALYTDHFVSFLSLALAGVRRQPDTRMMKQEHYWVIDNRKKIVSDSLPGILPETFRDIIGSITQAGLRTWNDNRRDQLKDFGDVFEFVCHAFPKDSADVDLNKLICKIWDHALKGWGLCRQTYRSDNTLFGKWLRDEDTKYHKYAIPSDLNRGNEAGASTEVLPRNVSVVIKKVREVWDIKRIQEVVNRLDSIDQDPNQLTEPVYELLEDGHRAYLDKVNSEIEGLIWKSQSKPESIPSVKDVMVPERSLDKEKEPEDYSNQSPEVENMVEIAQAKPKSKGSKQKN